MFKIVIFQLISMLDNFVTYENDKNNNLPLRFYFYYETNNILSII